MIARSKPNVDYNFLWECICGKGQQIDNTISSNPQLRAYMIQKRK